MPLYDNLITGKNAGTGVGTNAGVTVTIPAVPGKRISPVGIQCSGDVACLVTIESPAATVLWRQRYAGAFAMSESFRSSDIVGASGQALLVKISASTSNCEANIQAGIVPR